MAIGATALFKTGALLEQLGASKALSQPIDRLASAELMVATLIIGYVTLRYCAHYFPRAKART